MRDLIRHGSIGPVYSAGHEILRRIFVTVRDRNWQEVAPTQWENVVDEQRRTISIVARHTSELLDFEWRGTLDFSADMRALRFAFKGTALIDMEVCRLGLIVLHSPESLIGSRLTAVGQPGEQRLTVPAKLSPQPIVNGVPLAMTEPFSDLRIERADLGMIQLRFAGDRFELEDQRNWGDASFKSYCTPLRLGYPRAVKAGTTISHSVEADFTPATVRSIERREPPLETGRFPTIGRQWNQHKIEPEYHHAHVDVTGSEGAARLRALLRASSTQRIEIAVGQAEQGVPADQLELMATHGSRISRVLVYGEGTALPTKSGIEHWRRALDRPGLTHVLLLAATRGYYVEYNRSEPLDAAISGIAFPLTATVHSADAATIVDNVRTIRDMAETARQLTGLSELVLAPLALHFPPAKQQFPQRLVAPWVAATLMHAALAGISSVTLADDVVEAIQREGGVELLVRLIHCAGVEVAAFDAALPRELHVAAFKASAPEARQLLAANLSKQAKTISLGASLRAVRSTDALSGAVLAENVADVEIPAHSVVWIEVASPSKQA